MSYNHIIWDWYLGCLGDYKMLIVYKNEKSKTNLSLQWN